MKDSLVLLFMFFFFVGCKPKADIGSDQDHFNMELPEDFLVFYDQFHRDSIYQLDHIIFPLQGNSFKNMSDPILIDTIWEKENWKIHHKFDDMGGTFKNSFVNFKNIITETISDKSDQFSMRRRFAKIDNQWHLIYYKDMGPG